MDTPASNVPLGGELVGRRLVEGVWKGVYQIPQALMSDTMIDRSVAAGLEVLSRRFSHHYTVAWWYVDWEQTVAGAQWCSNLMDLPRS